MKIYHQVERFHPRTGAPYMATMLKEFRCDLTGEVIESSYPSYILEYGEEDPCFGSDGTEFEFGEEFHIDVYSFLSGPYHFADGACSRMMYENSGEIDFAGLCRASRIACARKLISDGTVTAEQLDNSERK